MQFFVFLRQKLLTAEVNFCILIQGDEMIYSGIEKLNFYDISVLNQTWKKGSFFSYETKSRPCFGICFIVSGAIKYITKSKEVTAASGDVIILKKSTRYRALFEDGSTHNILINFSCAGLGGDEDFFESMDEEIIALRNRRDLKNRFFEILSYDFMNNRRCMVKSVLYSIFDEMFNCDLTNALFAEIKHFLDSDTGLKLKETELAEKCSVSVSTLQRVFKNTYGKTISEYKNELKISKAKKLLITGNYTIEEIAEMLGFCDSAYFSRCFKRAEGRSPKKYLKQYYTM